ncbi:MAG: DEAD/DEAH box helicase [Polyangia bacterium]
MSRTDEEWPTTLDETRAALTDMGHRRTGEIPLAVLVGQTLVATEGGDWPLRKAAFEALLRRFKFAARDGLAVIRRPAGKRVLGRYATAAASARARGGRQAELAGRPYLTEIWGVEPLEVVCDCPDFLRGSLGLCKHLLCVLDHVYSSSRRVADARKEQERRAVARVSGGKGKVLTWNPIRALTGAGDRLAGIAVGGSRPGGKFGNGGQMGLDAKTLGKDEIREKTLSELLRAIERGGTQADVATVALLREEHGRVALRLGCAGDEADLLREVRSLKRRLYPYQREGVRRFFQAGRLLLADDMGLGKTTQAIAACHALYRSGRIKRGLLIVPTALKPQWQREWEQTTDVPLRPFDGGPDERAVAYRAFRSGFGILGYEQFLRDHALVRERAPEMVVLDEAQRIKNWATKSAALVKSLDSKYRLALTGTPLENRLEELASLLDWIDDLALAPKWRLPAWHTFQEGDGGKGRSGARNLDTLRTRLSGCVLRRVRQEVLTQLPARTDTRIPVPMTEQQRVEHDDLIQPIAALLSRAARRPLLQAEFLRLMSLLNTQRIISNGLGQLNFEDIWPAYARARPDGALLEGLFAPKLGQFRTLVEDVAVTQGRKIVVFSQWRRMLRLAEWSLRDILERNRLRAAFFTGAESQVVRTRSLVDFHDEPDVRILFLSDAGGVGLNLQHAASCCVNLELPWNPAVLEQRIGRIYRLGQSRPIDVYNFVNEYGIESRIATLLSTKKALFSGLFDGTSDEIRFDGKTSFLADVERLVGDIPGQANQGQQRGLVSETSAEGESEFGSVPDEPSPAPLLDEEAAGSAAVDSPSEPSRLPEPDLFVSPPSPEVFADAPSPPPSSVGELFGRITSRRTHEGGLILEAPPEAAAELAALFAGMASLMTAMAAPTSKSHQANPP